MSFDVLIQNARILDGTGGPWARGALGVKDGLIAALGRRLAGRAAETVDAGGRFLCPGFIDTHTHSDYVFFVDAAAQSKVRQGVTTEVTGNCGMSGAPIMGASRHAARTTSFGFEPFWSTVPEYLEALRRRPATVNRAPLVGHGTLRAAVVGLEDRAPGAGEWARMQGLLAEALEAGAFGLSFGLYFPPGAYARPEELAGLARIVGEGDGLVAAHIRDEGSRSVGFLPAVRELLEIGRRAEVPIHFSHLKAFGPDVWGQSEEVVREIEQARSQGLEVTCDQYPYTATGGIIAADVLPVEFVRGRSAGEVMELVRDPVERRRVRERVEVNLGKRGGAERLTIANYGADTSLEGKTLQEIAAGRAAEPADVVLDMIGRFYDGRWTCESLSREDVDRIFRCPWTMVGSDGSSLSTEGPLSQGNPHPRNFGAFPRVLADFVRDRRLVGLEEAIRKMTSLPARRFQIHRRGLLAEGMWADLVLLDLAAVRDASFERPKQYPQGIDEVMVNGRWVIKGGAFTGALPGRLAHRG